MALKRFVGFIGPSYLSGSVNAACQRSINLMPEVLEVDGEPKAVGMLRSRPGLGAALCTLPASPVRGMLAGGSPLFDAARGRLFVAAGAGLYEVFGDGTYATLGAILNDGKPVQMAVNGTQLAVMSGGNFYLHDGISLTQPEFIEYSGTVDTSEETAGGSTLYYADLDSGTSFDIGLVGQTISIGNNTYTVAALISSSRIQLGTSAGTQTNVEYTSYAITGTCDQVLTLVTWLSGPKFTTAMAGTTLAINGIAFTVASVQDPAHLTLSSALISQANATWSSCALNPIAAQTGLFQGGYFIVAGPKANQFFFSGLWDGKTWNPLDFAVKESYPDHIGCLLGDHDELYVFGESTTEGWRASPSPPAVGSPYARDMSISMPVGIGAVYSAASTRNGPVWLAADLRGNPVFYGAQGFTPIRLSTHAAEETWAAYSTVQDAETFVMEIDGHELIVITFPTGDATWVYDLTASQELGRPIWSEWGSSTDGVTFHRFRGRGHAYIWGSHFVGDYATGAIYPLSSTNYTDNGSTIYCVRTFPHLNETGLRQFISLFQLDLETGLAALTVKLDWSHDFGHTFIQPKSLTIAQNDTHANPNYRARARFWRLGARRDWVPRLTVTGACRKALVGCYIDYSVGLS